MLTFCAIHLAQPEGIEAMPRRKSDPLEIATMIVIVLVIAGVAATLVSQLLMAGARWVA